MLCAYLSRDAFALRFQRLDAALRASRALVRLGDAFCPLAQSLLTVRASDLTAGQCPTGATRSWRRTADGFDPLMPVYRNGVIVRTGVGPHGLYPEK